VAIGESISTAARLIREAAETTARLDIKALEAAAGLLFATWRAGGSVLSCGNGGSASTASHFSADVAKLTIVPGRPRVRSLCLNDNVSALTAWTNDVGFAAAFAEQAGSWLDKDATLVAFSVHGGSPDKSVSSNVADVCSLAREKGAAVIGVTGFDGGLLAGTATVHLNVPAHDEPVATPLIESIHLLIQHALCLALRERIVHSDLESR
jgi:D-sedoheptulose 7-phosphate isomerase